MSNDIAGDGVPPTNQMAGISGETTKSGDSLPSSGAQI